MHGIVLLPQKKLTSVPREENLEAHSNGPGTPSITGGFPFHLYAHVIADISLEVCINFIAKREN